MLFRSVSQSRYAGEPVRSMGCVEEPENTSPIETCCRCGKQLLFTRVWRDGKKYCTDCDIEMTYGKEPEPIAPGVIKDAIDLESHNHHINQVAPIEPVCVVCGKTATIGYDYCGEHAGIKAVVPIGVEVPQYELDDEPVDDIPGPIMVEKEFDRKAFVIEMIERVMELSQLRNAPAEITLELIDAVLVVA